MKYKNYIYFLILVFTTIAGLWILPTIVKKATYSPDNYPFVYYSSGLKQLALINYKDKEMPLTDRQGNRYNTAQFDSLMPLLNFRQLISDGRLPDSIGGYELTPPLLRSKSVVFRYAPKDVNTPDAGLYILFESMPKRVGLEMPNDVFRMKNNIEFIDAETNTVDVEKSEKFQSALDKADYQFPAKWLIGNPNPRKAYDEGYFSLDSKGDLYHIKMVNGRPYVRNTLVSENIDIASFSIFESPDKRFYGFLFSKQGDVYIIEGDEGKYIPIKLDINPINLQKDQFQVMGNLLYWTITVTTPEGKLFYGLNTENLKRIDEYGINRENNKWDKVSKWIFPVYLTFENANSDYVAPYVKYTGLNAFIINAVLALLAGILLKSSGKKRIFNILYIFITGIAGIMALLLLPYLRKFN